MILSAEANEPPKAPVSESSVRSAPPSSEPPGAGGAGGDLGGASFSEVQRVPRRAGGQQTRIILPPATVAKSSEEIAAGIDHRFGRFFAQLETPAERKALRDLLLRPYSYEDRPNERLESVAELLGNDGFAKFEEYQEKRVPLEFVDAWSESLSPHVPKLATQERLAKIILVERKAARSPIVIVKEDGSHPPLKSSGNRADPGRLIPSYEAANAEIEAKATEILTESELQALVSFHRRGVEAVQAFSKTGGGVRGHFD